jgi:mono/diheme cytochrome c family protein
VTTDKVLELPPDFRNLSGWELLAKMPVCDGCHARIDHGAQFFRYIEPGYHSNLANAVEQRSALYIRNQHDRRGEAESTPAGFAKLALEQPEFAQCMSKRVARHVFGKHMSGDDMAAVREVFDRDGTYRGMMSAALARYAQQRLAPVSRGPVTPVVAAIPAAVATPGDPDAELALSAPLRELLDEHCSDCHDDGGAGQAVWISSQPEVARSFAVRMLDAVGLERMPPTKERLDAATRRHLVATLAADLWPTAGARDLALAYYAGRLNNVEVHTRGTAMHAVAANVGLPPDPAMHVDRAFAGLGRDRVELTPDFALGVALDAVDSCNKLADAGDIGDCVARGVDLDRILVAPAPSAGW